MLTTMALWSLASPAHAHETRLAFLEVRALGAGDFVSVLKIPVTGATAWPIEVRLPATCAPRGPDLRSRQADSLVVEQRFSCKVSDAAPVMGLAGLAGGFVDVLVHIEDEHGNRLTRVASGALTEVPLSPGAAGAWDRLALGVEHILGGVERRPGQGLTAAPAHRPLVRRFFSRLVGRIALSWAGWGSPSPSATRPPVLLSPS